MTTYEPGFVRSITGRPFDARRDHEGNVEVNVGISGDPQWLNYCFPEQFEPGPESYGMCSHPDPHTIEQAHECDALAREEREDVSGEREAS